MTQQKTLLVVTDYKDSDFVKECSLKLFEDTASSGWQLQWLEAGPMSMGERLRQLAFLCDERKPDAALYVHLTLDPEQAAVFRVRGIALGCLASRFDGAHWVAADEKAGGAKVAAEFLRYGHKRFAVISGPQDSLECNERVQGFIEALVAAGIAPENVAQSRTRGYGPKDGYHTMQRLLPLSGPKPTAIFAAAGDLVAQGAIQLLKEKKLEVPRDISLVGYDNLPFTETMTPPLSTVRQPLTAMASRLFRALSTAAPGQKDGFSTQSVTPIFVPRKSCAQAAGSAVAR